MSLKVRTLVERGLGTEAKIIIIDTDEHWRMFQKLVQNGSGLYPDLPAEIKTFADEVTMGQPMQEYVDDVPAGEERVAVCKVCGDGYSVSKITYMGVSAYCHRCLDPKTLLMKAPKP